MTQMRPRRKPRSLHKTYGMRLREYRWFADRMKARGEEVMLNAKAGVWRQWGTESIGDAVEPEAALHAFESTGKLPACNDAEALKWLLIGKQARDWHITQWAEGMLEGTCFWAELRRDRVLPTLVDSARRAAKKMWLRRNACESS